MVIDHVTSQMWKEKLKDLFGVVGGRNNELKLGNVAKVVLEQNSYLKSKDKLQLTDHLVIEAAYK